MKLYYSVNSPFARKARVILLEKKLKAELVEVMPLDSPPELLAVNPLSKIPALVTEKATLFDSPIICEYLDGLSPEPRFFPEGEARWKALELAALADGLMTASVACVIQSRLPEDQRSAYWCERQEAAIKRTIDYVANKISLDGWHIGTMGLAVALSYIQFRQPHLEWETQYPAFKEWLKQANLRPVMLETQPQP